MIEGPGTNLWNMLSDLGVRHTPNCSCEILMDLMDELGPEGCRREYKNLLHVMRKNKEGYGWSDYLRAGTNALLKGRVFKYKINPLDPLPSLLNAAISLTEEQQSCQNSVGSVG